MNCSVEYTSEHVPLSSKVDSKDKAGRLARQLSTKVLITKYNHKRSRP